jgi:hypothetical protein
MIKIEIKNVERDHERNERDWNKNILADGIPEQ